MSQKAITFDTFTVERTYKASPERVFDAWADPVKKRRWFVEGEGWTIDAYESDFREGGFERSRFRFKDGPEMTNDTVFLDIVPNRRIVCSYGMTMAIKRFSVSLATVEFELNGSGTLLRCTEQGAYFEGSGENPAAGRREGFAGLLDALATELGEPLHA